MSTVLPEPPIPSLYWLSAQDARLAPMEGRKSEAN